MLDVALKFLQDQVTGYLKVRAAPTTIEAKMSALVNDAGKYAFAQDQIAATVINLEEERTFKAQLPEYTYVNGQHVVLEPELKLNLYVMFAANFQVYGEALKFLSHVLTFFQSHSIFTSEEYPALDPRIEKLTVEMQSLTFEQLNQIWAYIGGKQLPSMVYKVRMVILQDEVPTAVQPPITTLNMELMNR